MADEFDDPRLDVTENLRAEAPTATGTFSTELFLTSAVPAPNDTGTFVPRSTPGDVGVCLSGGGSRAFAAGIGQLQALETLQANGSSLLDQTRALATVSGGGWIGIPFTFLPSTVGDGDFLGTYVAPAGLTPGGLASLPSQGIANHITSHFSIPSLCIQALLLYVTGAPGSELWQLIMGHTFLKPYGLYKPGSRHLPTQFFSYDATSLAGVRDHNPDLAGVGASLVAQVAGQQRPYLISLAALSVSTTSQSSLLAPVQSTPFIAGMLSTPPGAVDANQHPVGGGAVWPFAFDSTPTASAGGLTKVSQSFQWSLTDALGTSSAAFAQTLIALMQEWRQHPTRFAAALRLHGPAAADKIARSPEEASRLQAKVESAVTASLTEPVASDLYRALQELSILNSIVPKYLYWSPKEPPTGGAIGPSDFADGGSLENTGIAAMLSYADIRNVIGFLNVGTPLHRDEQGRIVVDECLPPLFGYQPYDDKLGYVPYAGAPKPSYPVYQNSQVFASSDFDALLQGLWNAGRGGGAAVFSQTLTTLPNSWFGVAGGATVTVVWSYLTYASGWYGAITDPSVRTIVDQQQERSAFPNYNTLSTELTPTQINLLSNFSSWMVQGPDNATAFTALYASGPAAP